jgi:phosphoglycolate phosphatase-like HAD superfamily hydrolase
MVPGSKEFLKYLCRCGVKNYFVTGAVVERDIQGIPSGTMYEEISTLGYEVGKDKLISDFHGSSWHEKLPKQEIMRQICLNEGINPSQVLIIGDGRSEIAAGVAMGAITISRLDSEAVRTREIHRQLKTNIIIEKYDMENIKGICRLL